MGRAAAIAFAREGANVAINYYPTEELDAQEVIALIQSAARKGVPLPGDLRDESFCQKLVLDAFNDLGGLDILVSNAARQQSHASVLEIPTEEFDSTMNYIKSLAKQLAPKGIRVNGVAPGPIWTPLQVSGGATQEKLKEFGSQTPLGRPGQPAELASIYVQLAANDASYATGQIYGSAGGSGQP
jgi:NAD(P)-dependent dehydrogenase (short-subunit alcohol dehydrogenase family)